MFVLVTMNEIKSAELYAAALKYAYENQKNVEYVSTTENKSPQAIREEMDAKVIKCLERVF